MALIAFRKLHVLSIASAILSFTTLASVSLALCTLRQILNILGILQLLTDLQISLYLKCMYQFHLRLRLPWCRYCGHQTQVMLY